jgi:hypothetical protein
MIEKAIISLLNGVTQLTDADRQAAQASLLTLLGGRRIYPQAAPESLGYPYGVVRRTGGEHVRHLLGRGGLGQPRIAVDFYAATYNEVRQLVDAAFLILDGYRGKAGTFFIQGIFASDEPDDYSPPQHSEAFGVQAAGMEFNCHANEQA